MSHIVNPELAKGCTDFYQDIYQNSSSAEIAAAYTESVSFSVAAIRNLLYDAEDNDTVEIKLGVYTDEFCAKYPKAIPGRLTTFVYVRSSGYGDPVEEPPLNVGTPQP